MNNQLSSTLFYQIQIFSRLVLLCLLVCMRSFRTIPRKDTANVWKCRNGSNFGSGTELDNIGLRTRTHECFRSILPRSTTLRLLFSFVLLQTIRFVWRIIKLKHLRLIKMLIEMNVGVNQHRVNWTWCEMNVGWNYHVLIWYEMKWYGLKWTWGKVILNFFKIFA